MWILYSGRFYTLTKRLKLFSVINRLPDSIIELKILTFFLKREFQLMNCIECGETLCHLPIRWFKFYQRFGGAVNVHRFVKILRAIIWEFYKNNHNSSRYKSILFVIECVSIHTCLIRYIGGASNVCVR